MTSFADDFSLLPGMIPTKKSVLARAEKIHVLHARRLTSLEQVCIHCGGEATFPPNGGVCSAGPQDAGLFSIKET